MLVISDEPEKSKTAPESPRLAKGDGFGQWSL
jgi:hypothetical protein